MKTAIAFLALALCCSLGYTSENQPYKSLGQRNRFFIEGMICYFNSIKNGPSDEKPAKYKQFLEDTKRCLKRLAGELGTTVDKLFTSEADQIVYNKILNIYKSGDLSEVEGPLEEFLNAVLNTLGNIEENAVNPVSIPSASMLSYLQNGDAGIYSFAFRGIKCLFDNAQEVPQGEKEAKYKYICENTLKLMGILSIDFGISLETVFSAMGAKEAYNELLKCNENGDYRDLAAVEKTMNTLRSLIEKVPGDIVGILLNALPAILSSALNTVSSAVGSTLGALGSAALF